MPTLRNAVLAVALAVSGLLLAACENTIRGAGQDIEDTADAVGDATRKVVQ